jgi:hypothetical protein
MTANTAAIAIRSRRFSRLAKSAAIHVGQNA